MARTGANSSGPSPSGSTIASQTQVLDREIGHSFSDFQQHADQCGRCRHPVRTYDNGKDLCRTGEALSYNITQLLYTRAKHSPNGRFTVQHRYDWEAVGELVRIITHFNQGAYSDEICDPAAATVPEDAAVDRGSRFRTDMQRRDNAARSSPHYSPRHPPHQQPFGDPRLSVQDVPSGLAQADSRWADERYPNACPAPQAESPSSNNSTRSVHFDPRIRVRLFDENS